MLTASALKPAEANACINAAMQPAVKNSKRTVILIQLSGSRGYHGLSILVRWPL